jgi:hypothetical protein
MRIALLLALTLGCGAARPATTERSDTMTSFGDDLAFLRAHVPDLVVLERGGARVAIAPRYQGRVMTSTARGEAGASCGWIHRTLIASGERAPHINAFGGEDRFWLGPEGGQFGLYFAPGAPFDLAHWQVPGPIDWDAWEVVDRADESVSLRADMQLVNASGTTLSIHVDRRVGLLGDGEIEAALGAEASGLDVVAYASTNTITNTGAAPWREETGLVSIWILAMYPPSPRAVVVLPFLTSRGGAPVTGPIVNDAYFGPVPADRLRVDEALGALFFRADGERRGKIGLPWARAEPWMGSWDPQRGVLTLVRYTLPSDPAPYVNSMWERQAEPYAGDVVNSYDDGPLGPGQPPLGPFYELESSSPALALTPGASQEHVHTTFHLQGARSSLDAIARAHLHAGLDEIEHALDP